jgi:hypothetical protein
MTVWSHCHLLTWHVVLPISIFSAVRKSEKKKLALQDSSTTPTSSYEAWQEGWTPQCWRKWSQWGLKMTKYYRSHKRGCDTEVIQEMSLWSPESDILESEARISPPQFGPRVCTQSPQINQDNFWVEVGCWDHSDQFLVVSTYLVLHLEYYAGCAQKRNWSGKCLAIRLIFSWFRFSSLRKLQQPSYSFLWALVPVVELAL